MQGFGKAAAAVKSASKPVSAAAAPSSDNTNMPRNAQRRLDDMQSALDASLKSCEATLLRALVDAPALVEHVSQHVLTSAISVVLRPAFDELKAESFAAAQALFDADVNGFRSELKAAKSWMQVKMQTQRIASGVQLKNQAAKLQAQSPMGIHKEEMAKLQQQLDLATEELAALMLEVEGEEAAEGEDDPPAPGLRALAGRTSLAEGTLKRTVVEMDAAKATLNDALRNLEIEIDANTTLKETVEHLVRKATEATKHSSQLELINNKHCRDIEALRGGLEQARAELEKRRKLGNALELDQKLQVTTAQLDACQLQLQAANDELATLRAEHGGEAAIISELRAQARERDEERTAMAAAVNESNGLREQLAKGEVSKLGGLACTQLATCTLSQPAAFSCYLLLLPPGPLLTSSLILADKLDTFDTRRPTCQSILSYSIAHVHTHL